MGSQLNKPVSEYIGELSFEKEQLQLFLPCETRGEVLMKIVICDERGKSVFKKKINLASGKSLINFECTTLKEGKYNAWIEVNGQTYLRQLTIEVEVPRQDLLSRFRKWL